MTDSCLERKMHKMDIDQETTRVDDDRLNGEERDHEMNTSLLAGLNLVLIMSFLSLSAEDRSSFDEMQEIDTRDFDQRHKPGVTKLSFQTRRQQVNQLPAVERQTSRVHTKIRDSR